ncbi:MAG: phosphomethylpyrimidine synthase ThiC [Candidatus Eisenbacteria bacterium]|nr:phosphomethylpyrimidine synthase ThiC [Candidatus Eisenbacteria bacterium]
MTQIEKAREGILTDEVLRVSDEEGQDASTLVKKVASGKVVILKNRMRDGMKPVGIGGGLKVKVNANIGTSSDASSLEEEQEKLRAALSAKADTIMDLSTGGDLGYIRRELLKKCPVPLGTVPIYEVAVEKVKNGSSIVKMSGDEILDTIERQAKEGVDFVTVHCGVNLQTMEKTRSARRVADVVSRGGAFLLEWMFFNKKENPLYERYDELLQIAREYELTLSLGDGLRPGAIADATDTAQVGELLVIAELVRRARSKGVQTMVEGPGHVPLDEIEANVRLEKELCDEAPFYVLGPLVTDVCPGYDHIVSAIGGALAAYHGADFLCYVTPAEHLKLPDADDVRDGVIASRIAAHAADVARRNPAAIEWDMEMSKARKNLDWEKEFTLSIDPEKARRLRGSRPPKNPELCTMCGQFCAMKQVEPVLGKKGELKSYGKAHAPKK